MIISKKKKYDGIVYTSQIKISTSMIHEIITKISIKYLNDRDREKEKEKLYLIQNSETK